MCVIPAGDGKMAKLCFTVHHAPLQKRVRRRSSLDRTRRPEATGAIPRALRGQYRGRVTGLAGKTLSTCPNGSFLILYI